MDAVYEIHVQLRKKIADNFGTFQIDQYRTLLNFLTPKLTTKELEGARDMYDILDSLQRNGTIAIGKYEYLIEIMAGFNEDVKRVIEKAQTDITQILPGGQVTYIADRIRKYERKLDQTGLVWFCKTHQNNLGIKDLENFFKEVLRFECCDIPFENKQKSINDAKAKLNERGEMFYCFVCFVIGDNEEFQLTFNEITEMTDGFTDKPKLFIFLSSTDTVPCPHSNDRQNDSDLLVVNATAHEESRMVDVLTRNYNSKHFEEMLVCFRHDLAHSEQNNSTVPWSMSTLTKLFYLEAFRTTGSK